MCSLHNIFIITEALSTFHLLIDKRPDISFTVNLLEAALFIIHSIIVVGSTNDQLDKFTEEKGLPILIECLWWPRELKDVLDKKPWQQV